ncbi:MAG: SsrA-binding protein [Azonexus sp.]
MAKGNKLHDKRQDEHEKDWKREAQRAMKERQH